MHHLAQCPKAREQKSNSDSNSDNTPKRLFCRNYMERKVVITSLNLLQKLSGLPAEICVKPPKVQTFLTKKIKRNIRTFFCRIGGFKFKRFCDKAGDRTFSPRKTESFFSRMTDLLTLRQVERELGVSRSSLWRLRKLGLLRTVALGGIVRVRRQDLTRFIEREMLSERSL